MNIIIKMALPPMPDGAVVFDAGPQPDTPCEPDNSTRVFHHRHDGLQPSKPGNGPVGEGWVGALRHGTWRSVRTALEVHVAKVGRKVISPQAALLNMDNPE